MTNTQLLIAASAAVITLIVALWGIAERNTSRLIDGFEKRMNERDEKLLAKIEGLDGRLTAKLDGLRAELTAQNNGLQFQIKTLDSKFDGELRRELNAVNERLNRLERAA